MRVNGEMVCLLVVPWVQCPLTRTIHCRITRCDTGTISCCDRQNKVADDGETCIANFRAVRRRSYSYHFNIIVQPLQEKRCLK